MGRAGLLIVAAVLLLSAWLLRPRGPPRRAGLFMHEPVRAGYTQAAHTETGRRVVLETLAVRPRLFLIEDFLSAEEAEALVAASQGRLERSGTLRDEGVIRVSEQAWLDHADEGDAAFFLSRRVAAVAGLPPWLVHGSEPIQTARYGPGGHYYLHLDSGRNHGVGRFLTLMVFLNDVETGGETSFPIADDAAIPFPDGDVEEDDVASMPVGWRDGDPAAPAREPWDLSVAANCGRRVSVAPKAGRAVLWYNHLPAAPNPDPARWTELGPLDRYSLHARSGRVLRKEERPPRSDAPRPAVAGRLRRDVGPQVDRQRVDQPAGLAARGPAAAQEAAAHTGGAPARGASLSREVTRAVAGGPPHFAASYFFLMASKRVATSTPADLYLAMRPSTSASFAGLCSL